MEMKEGACRLGLWFVRVWWTDAAVHRVRFATTGIGGDVPALIRRYCSGQRVDPAHLATPATEGDTTYAAIYRAVREVRYGETQTYGGIAERAGTKPQVVGNALARNPVPLVVPCHRITAKHGIGGFTPSPEIKKMLLDMESRSMRRVKQTEKIG